MLPLELVLQTVGANSGSKDDPKLYTIGRLLPLSRPLTSPEWFHADEIPHVVVFIEFLDAVHRTTPPDADFDLFCAWTQPQCPDNSPEGSCVNSSDCCPGEVSRLKVDGVSTVLRFAPSPSRSCFHGQSHKQVWSTLDVFFLLFFPSTDDPTACNALVKGTRCR